MKKASIFISLLTILSICTAASALTGIAKIIPTTYGSTINPTGFIRFDFDTSANKVSVTVNVDGNFADATDYAIHVHLYGDQTDNALANSAGSHYAGLGTSTHGCPDSPSRHEGDMGNWTANANQISATKEFDLLQLTGSYSIIGRAVVIHEHFDNCSAQPTGAAGNRLGFGVIGIYSDATNTANNQFNVTSAVAVLYPTNATGTPCNSCNGTFYFTQVYDGSGNPSSVQITGHIHGLTDGLGHGIHVHTYGDQSSDSGSSAGAHWNPDNTSHGVPPYSRHRGDLGSIQSYDSSSSQDAYYQDLSNTLIGSLNNIVGRALVLHEFVDHGNGTGCDQTGGSGRRIAWGVIGLMSPTTNVTTIPGSVSLDTTYDIVPCSATPSPTPTVSPSTNGGAASNLQNFLKGLW